MAIKQVSAKSIFFIIFSLLVIGSITAAVITHTKLDNPENSGAEYIDGSQNWFYQFESFEAGEGEEGGCY